jgi:hypothetical protein
LQVVLTATGNGKKNDACFKSSGVSKLVATADEDAMSGLASSAARHPNKLTASQMLTITTATPRKDIGIL